MKLKVTCPQCGHEFEGEVSRTIDGEQFVVCKKESYSTVHREATEKHYFCNTYIVVRENSNNQIIKVAG